MLPTAVTPTPEHARTLGVSGILTVNRIWPRAPGRLSLELLDDDGALLAGQWFADGTDRNRIADATRARAGRPGHVQCCPSQDARGDHAGTVMVQAHGADRRLRALPRLLAEPSTRLLVHRPERRAVVYRPASGTERADRSGGTGDRDGGDYLRVFRPGRTETVLRAAEAARTVVADLAGLTVPAVRSHLADDGVVVTAAMPGESMRDLGVTGRPGSLVGAGALGRLLRHYERVHPPTGLPHRDVHAELDWAGTWLDRVRRHLPHAHAALAAALDVAAGRLHRTTPSPSGVVHGDLHDGQVLVADDGAVGVLDWDTFAVGESALDAANVWAHADLRRLLGQWPDGHAEEVWDAVVDSWQPSRAQVERAGAYRRLILLRLACQYAFRPARDHVVDGLVELAEGNT